MQVDPTSDPEGNELADKIIQERASYAQLRHLLNGMTYAQKIAVAQIACNQMAGNPSNQLIQLKPIGEFDDQIKSAFVLLGSLPSETLAEIAIEILSEVPDRNE
ncbi:hypothetical protein QUB47_19095 [Microcoleus sp. AT9_B5]